MAEKPLNVANGTRDTSTEPARSHPIELGFQLRLIGKVGLLLAAGTLLPAAILWVVAGRMEAISYFDAFRSIGVLRLELLRVSLLSGAVQLVTMGVFVAGVALFASHKIAGPLVRFEHCVRALAKGNFSQSLRFRRGDQDEPLVAAFQELTGRLRHRVTGAKACAEELTHVLEEIKRCQELSTQSPEGIAEILRMIRRLSEQLRHSGTMGGVHLDS